MCARCEELEDEIAWLRSELGASVDATTLAAIRGRFSLTRAQAIIVMCLFNAKCRVVSFARLAEATPVGVRSGESDCQLVRSHICRIRKVVGEDAIETVRGDGWRISNEFYSRVLASRPTEPVRAAA